MDKSRNARQGHMGSYEGSGAMRGNEKGEASDKATPNINRQPGSYPKSVSRSREIFADQLGLLLLRLQGPLSRRQSKTGWQVFEALLSARYAGDMQ